MKTLQEIIRDSSSRGGPHVGRGREALQRGRRAVIEIQEGSAYSRAVPRKHHCWP